MTYLLKSVIFSHGMNIVQARLEKLKQHVSFSGEGKPLNAKNEWVLQRLDEVSFNALLLFVRNQEAEEQKLDFADNAFSTGLRFVNQHKEYAARAWITQTEVVKANPTCQEDYANVVSYWARVYGLARTIKTKKSREEKIKNATIKKGDPRLRKDNVAWRIKRNPYSRHRTHTHLAR